jgi:hypothetical protein
MIFSRLVATIYFKNKRKLLERNLKKSQNFLKGAINYKLSHVKITVECAQYVQINSYDLLILSYNYLKAKENWDKCLHARTIAVYIVDFFDNIFPIIGQAFLKKIEFIIEEETIKKFKELNREVSELKRKYDKKLRSIRNITIAHKAKIGSDLYHEINTINHKEVYDIASELTKLITLFNRNITVVLNSQINNIE